jgi:type IX secretion system PorP/SprF family membrane protein
VLILSFQGIYSQYLPLMNGYFKTNQFINPASAGVNDHMVAYTGIRKQWVRIKGAPSTQMFAFDSPLTKQRIGLGGVFYRDKVGATVTNGLQFNYSYRIRVSRKMRLAFGADAGLETSRFNVNELELIDAADQTFADEYSRVNKLKLGAGVMLYDKKITIGLSMNDAVKSSGFGNLIAYLQYKKKVNREWSYTPGILVKMNTLLIKQAEFSVLTSYKQQFSLNLGLRTNGSILAGVGFNPTSQLLVLYSYDYIAGRLRSYTSGSHELTLKYDFVQKYKTSSHRSF